VQHRFEETHLDDAAHGLLQRITAQAAQLRAELQKAMDRHIRVRWSVFGQVADQALGRDRVLEHVESTD
jgi:hypothetical protein